MLIQNLIPRRDESPVILGDGITKIAFKPNEQGDHVCDVKDKDHIKQLIRHKGCYRPYSSEESKLEKEEKEESARKERLQKEQQAKDADAGNQKNPNPGEGAKTDGDSHEKPSTGEGEGDKPLTEDQLKSMERDALADHYEKLTGRKPHHNAGKEKLIEAILSHKPGGDKA